MKGQWGDRVHSMDALRASSMMLLVPIHVCGLIAVNGEPSAILTGIAWVIHLFRLPLFFAMSGFFLNLVCARRGLRATLRRRALRIAVPLAVGLAVLVPLLMILSAATDVSISAAGPATSLFGLAPSYLWFLWYLLIIDACAMLLLRFAPRAIGTASKMLAWTIGNPVGVVLLAVPTGMLLIGQADWMPTAPSDTFRIEPAMFAYYTTFFVFGMALHSVPRRVEALGRETQKWGLAALASGLVALVLFTVHNSRGVGVGVHAVQLAAFGIATVTALHALLGLATRHLNVERPSIRYVADSSYWIYLSHLQILVPLMAVSLAMNIPWPVALPTLTAATLASTILTYGLFVRYSPIGFVLNGPRRRPPVIRPGEAAARPA
jgi:glucans biosynthesis protein C